MQLVWSGCPGPCSTGPGPAIALDTRSPFSQKPPCISDAPTPAARTGPAGTQLALLLSLTAGLSIWTPGSHRAGPGPGPTALPAGRTLPSTQQPGRGRGGAGGPPAPPAHQSNGITHQDAVGRSHTRLQTRETEACALGTRERLLPQFSGRRCCVYIHVRPPSPSGSIFHSYL